MFHVSDFNHNLSKNSSTQGSFSFKCFLFLFSFMMLLAIDPSTKGSESITFHFLNSYESINAFPFEINSNSSSKFNVSSNLISNYI
jgi:hypothetical protein